MSSVIDAKPKSISLASAFFFLLENYTGYIIVRKFGYSETNTHSQKWEPRLQEKGPALGVESYVTS